MPRASPLQHDDRIRTLIRNSSRILQRRSQTLAPKNLRQDRPAIGHNRLLSAVPKTNEKRLGSRVDYQAWIKKRFRSRVASKSGLRVVRRRVDRHNRVHFDCAGIWPSGFVEIRIRLRIGLLIAANRQQRHRKNSQRKHCIPTHEISFSKMELGKFRSGNHAYSRGSTVRLLSAIAFKRK
jgi:hypothetical protein